MAFVYLFNGFPSDFSYSSLYAIQSINIIIVIIMIITIENHLIQ